MYSSRWSTLLIFCFINMCNAILWVTFAPISDISADYFGGDIGNATAVNMLATSFLIFFAPGIASFPINVFLFFSILLLYFRHFAWCDFHEELRDEEHDFVWRYS